MIIRDVPYISQWDSEATASQNDCGPVSLAMVLRYYGISVLADSITQMTGAGKGFVNFAQLSNVAQKYGVETTYSINNSFDEIVNNLNKSIPVIALIEYKYLSSRQDSYEGPHIVVVVGYDDDNVYIHDPDFKDNFRADGKYHAYKRSEFMTAWNATTTYGNSSRTLFIVHGKIQPTIVVNGNEDTAYRDKIRSYNPYLADSADRVIDMDKELNKLRDSTISAEDHNRIVKDKEQVITNLNQQINDRNNDITRINAEKSAMKTELDAIQMKYNTTADIAKKVPSLEDEIFTMKKSRQDWYTKEDSYIKQINELNERIESQNKSFTKLIKDSIYQLFKSVYG